MTNTADTNKSHFAAVATDAGPGPDTDKGELAVDIDELRHEVQSKYAAVADDPSQDFHFHTGRYIAERCGYDEAVLDALPDVAVESFAGVANPWAHRAARPGEHVVDAGSGAGFDCFVAGHMVGSTGQVVGVDMTPAMIDKSRAGATEIGADNVEFRQGYLEELPVEDGWADIVISNGVFNLAPDKKAAFTEAWRALRSGGVIQFADIANGQPVPEGAMRQIDLWTA
mgnify:FL=1